MIKYFLIGNLIISILCLAYDFDRFANSDEKTEPIYYEKLLMEFGFFFNSLVILVVSLLFGWI
jgi:hypothetical protein|nr:MAG TPA: hypothetical protein [Caudoviricetes sp.]